MNFFTSDTHFGHKTVIEYCKRPFGSVDEMNEEMIRRWNVCVGKSDKVYHLGDFSFLGSVATKAIVARLNGQIVLVQGNHDAKPNRFFAQVWRHGMLELAGVRVALSHYPYKGQDDHDSRDFSERQMEDDGLWLLHGHVHTEWKVRGRMINVGVDQWSYAPVSEDEIVSILKKGDSNDKSRETRS